MAAVLGLDEAQVQLGHMYRRGIVGPRNLSLALSYYRAAAVPGHGEALDNVAVCYESGFGARRNQPEAIRNLVWKDNSQAKVVVHKNLNATVDDGSSPTGQTPVVHVEYTQQGQGCMAIHVKDAQVVWNVHVCNPA